MTDPIQAFLDNGGFRPVDEPAVQQKRSKAEGLACALIHAYLNKDPAALENVAPELVGGIIAVDRFGAGQLAALQMLGGMWRELVGVPSSFHPPQDAEKTWVNAMLVASAMTMPAEAVPPMAVHDPDVAYAAIMVLAQELAVRLKAAASMRARVDDEATRFWAS